MKKEESLQLAVCNYLRLQYPDVIFTSESSGVRLTMGQAVKAKKMRSGSKLPDLLILEPKGKYSGLFIELKSEYPFKKNGEPKTDHIKEQMQMIERLREKGYYCFIHHDFSFVKEYIDDYMNMNTNRVKYSLGSGRYGISES